MSAQQQQASQSSLWVKGTEKMKQTRPDKLLACMRIFNVILSIAVMITAGSTIAAAQSCSSCNLASYTIISLYAILFALLLFLFEIRAGNRAKQFLDKNFGFLYAHRGKALMIIFIGTLCFSLISTSLVRWEWNVVVAVVVTVNGIFLCLVYYLHPTFSSVDLRPEATGFGGAPIARPVSTPNGDGIRDTRSTGSNYQYGEENLGPAYGRYSDSPFVISETSPQPPGIDENPYSSTISTAGMPFASGSSSTINIGPVTEPTYVRATGQRNENPFQTNDNPFADDSDQRV